VKPIYWLRSRQEEQELGYWLALVSYDKKDPSFSNRVYLLYLVIFFIILIFMSLLFFASGGAKLLTLIHAGSPSQAATLVETVLLAGWALISLFRSFRCSPIIFSEEDGQILAQTPLQRERIVLRWLGMPWLKNVVLFWVAAIILGFSVAELSFPTGLTVAQIYPYLGYGLRAWLGIIPLHLLLFILIWAAGVWRLTVPKKTSSLIALAILAVLMLVVFQILAGGFPPRFNLFNLFALQHTFAGSFNFAIFLAQVAASLIMLVVLYRLAIKFNLSRAVQETTRRERIARAAKYALNDIVSQEKLIQKLGSGHAATHLPRMKGWAVMLWLNLLRYQRSFSPGNVFHWLQWALPLLALPLLPDIASQLMIIVVWVIQVAVLAIKGLRADLSVWHTTRQLPLHPGHFLLSELAFPYLLVLFFSLAGYFSGGLLWGFPYPALPLIIALMPAAACLGIYHDLIRSASSGHLINGSLPGLSAAGLMLAVLYADFPLLFYTFKTDWIGFILALITSLGVIAWAYRGASKAYQNKIKPA